MKCWLLFLILPLIAPPAIAMAGSCTSQPLLSPDSQGILTGTLLGDFYTLVEGLYDSVKGSTKRLLINGKYLQVPPWFESSTDCTESFLKDDGDLLSSPPPSFSDYLVVSDELSELATVVSLAANDGRMMEIHNTISAMESATYPGMPCWVAEVTDDPIAGASISCRSEDTASDATARFRSCLLAGGHQQQLPFLLQSAVPQCGNCTGVSSS